MSDKNEKSQQETSTIKQEPSTSNKPPSYGTRFVQDSEGVKADTVQQRNIKKKMPLSCEGNKVLTLRQGGMTIAERLYSVSSLALTATSGAFFYAT